MESIIINRIIDPFTDERYDIMDTIYKYRIKFQCTQEENESLEKLYEAINEKYLVWKNRIRPERLKLWNDLLYKYLRVDVYETSFTEINWSFYMYPYEVIKDNACLFCLSSDVNNSYRGGVDDRSYNIFEDLNHNMKITVVSEEEFVENALTQVHNVINIRKDKINKLKPVVSVKWKK